MIISLDVPDAEWLLPVQALQQGPQLRPVLRPGYVYIIIMIIIIITVITISMIMIMIIIIICIIGLLYLLYVCLSGLREAPQTRHFRKRTTSVPAYMLCLFLQIWREGLQQCQTRTNASQLGMLPILKYFTPVERTVESIWRVYVDSM